MTVARHAALWASAATVALAGAAALANEHVVTLDPAATKIAFTLDATGHEVHGTLRLESGEIRFDPATGTASGTLAIDARSAETGNTRRDRTMHTKVLESERYPTMTFTAQRIEGRVTESGACEFRVHGSLALLGKEHPRVLPVKAEIGAQSVRATTTFSVPYVAWGLHDPSFLFLRVAKEVQVTVEANGTLTRAGTSTPSSSSTR